MVGSAQPGRIDVSSDDDRPAPMDRPLIMPVGKYKGQPVEVLANDPSYRTWLTGQDWFRQNHPAHYTIIVNNFATPDETPEHNALQARFLDDDLCRSLARTVQVRKGGYVSHGRSRVAGRAFENSGWDVTFRIDVITSGPLYSESGRELPGPGVSRWTRLISCAIELKPSLGDDYPAILRTVKARLQDGFSRAVPVVLFEQYSASGAPLDAVRRIYATAGVELIQLSDLR